MSTEAAGIYPPLEKRPLQGTICLFDVDETLTPARRVELSLSHCSQHMLTVVNSPPLPKCSRSCRVFAINAQLASSVSALSRRGSRTRIDNKTDMQVGGSNFAKQQEQLGTPSIPVTSLFDFCFSENGLTAYRLGKPLAGNSFIQWLGEDKYQEMVNFILRYLSEIKLPKKRGTFIEFRTGMINVSPVGRNASQAERDEFEA